MNRLFRWGIIIALLVLIGSGSVALRIVFVDKNDTVVPPLIGIPAVEAANKLQSVGLSARIDQVDSNQPEGTVISQAPSAGEKIEKGKSVIVRASRGGTQMMIPDIRGKEFTAAVQELDAAGFKIGHVVRVSDSLKPSGVVMAQNPASPATVINTRMIDLLVSKGSTSSRAETVQVPDLRGQSEALARQIIEQSNLSIARVTTIETNQVPEGTVFQTQPKAGTRIPFGGALTLMLARKVDPNTVKESANAPSTPPPDIVTYPVIDATAPEAEPSRPLAPEIPTWRPGQPVTPQTPPSTPSTPERAPSAGSTAAANTQNIPATPPVTQGRVAKVRYQVPPLTKALVLRIVLSDQSGTRVLREQQVSGGEYFSMDTPYTGGASITVQLGGEQVWQERYN
ncbi:MAG: PASTA domain-containing protein [Synergistaceae bacterium]|nr:PASTA domain-containing protein [Synergistaceae bacterium]